VYVLFLGTRMVYAVIARKWERGRTRRALVWRWWPGSPWCGPTWCMSRTRKIRRTGVLQRARVGAWLARLEARGLARTLFAMAATLALIDVMLPSGAPPYLARNMAILHGVFVALFTASGLLFRHASLAGLE
jgi:hypothetical protein